jgi:hypothetical protein
VCVCRAFDAHCVSHIAQRRWPLSTVAVHHSRKVGVASSILAVAYLFKKKNTGTPPRRATRDRSTTEENTKGGTVVGKKAEMIGETGQNTPSRRRRYCEMLHFFFSFSFCVSVKTAPP